MANAGIRTTMMVVHTASAVKNGHGKMIRHFMRKLARNKRNIAFFAGGMIAAAATGGTALVFLAPIAVIGVKRLYKKIRLKSMKGTVQGFVEGTLPSNDYVIKTVRYSIQHGELTKVADYFKDMYKHYDATQKAFFNAKTLKCRDWMKLLESYTQMAKCSGELERIGTNYIHFRSVLFGELEQMNVREFTGTNVCKVLDLIQDTIDREVGLGGFHFNNCLGKGKCCYMPAGEDTGEVVPLKPYYKMRNWEKRSERYRDPLVKMLNDAANSPYVFGHKRGAHLKQTNYFEWIDAVLAQAANMQSLNTMVATRKTKHKKIVKTTGKQLAETVGKKTAAKVGSTGVKGTSLDVSTSSVSVGFDMPKLEIKDLDVTNWSLAGAKIIVGIANNYWNGYKFRTRMTRSWRLKKRPQTFTEYVGTLRGKLKGSLESVVEEFIKLRAAHKVFMQYVNEEKAINCCEDAFICAAHMLKRQKHWCELGRRLPIWIEFDEQVWVNKEVLDDTYMQIGEKIQAELNEWLYFRHPPATHCNNGKGFCYGADPNRPFKPPQLSDSGPIHAISDEVTVDQGVTL